MMTLNWITVAAAVALPAVVLIAWTLWLLFNYMIAKRHGLDGLKATPPIARAFRPRDWALLSAAIRADQLDPTEHTGSTGEPDGPAEVGSDAG